jgi:hypothetical protein
MQRSPAAVLLRRIVIVRSIQLASRQRNPFSSQPRIVVFRARIAANCAVSHSGFAPAMRSGLVCTMALRVLPETLASDPQALARLLYAGLPRPGNLVS